MVATCPVTVSVPSAFAVALLSCRKECPDANAAQLDEVAVDEADGLTPLAATVGDWAAVEGAADEAVTWLMLAETDTLADGLADDAGAAGAVLDEVAAHPALASASPAVKAVIPQKRAPLPPD
jgi:hypothetical protein